MLNVSPDRLALESIDDRTMEALHRRNAMDLQLYAFARDLVDARLSDDTRRLTAA